MIKVKVRWLDGHFEEFEAIEYRAGGAYLWVKLAKGHRWIPTGQIRWFEAKEVK